MKKKQSPEDKPQSSFTSPHISVEEKEKAIREIRNLNKRKDYTFWQNIVISFIASLFYYIPKVFSHSYRLEKLLIHPETKHLLDDLHSKFICASWHNRLFYAVFSIESTILSKGHDVLAVVSASKDGEYIARIDKYFDRYYAIRGSSTRDARVVLKKLIRYVQQNFKPYILPDGPTGPKYKIKPGLSFLSKRLNLPIIPICYVAEKEWILTKSWDHFTIPKPFTKLIVEYGEPISIPENMDLEEGTIFIEKKMMEQMERLEKQMESYRGES